MVHVQYYEKLRYFKGEYNCKRKEISIWFSLNALLKFYAFFHEVVHHIINITRSPKIFNKILDYVAYGHKYFSSFQKYRRCKKYDVLFRKADVEFDKLGLELSEIRDGKVVFVSRKRLSEKEFKEVRRKFDYIWLLRKEAITLLKTRKQKSHKSVSLSFPCFVSV